MNLKATYITYQHSLETLVSILPYLSSIYVCWRGNISV